MQARADFLEGWESLENTLSLPHLRRLILFFSLYVIFSILFLAAVHYLFFNSADYSFYQYSALTLPLSFAVLSYTRLTGKNIVSGLYLSRKNITAKGISYGILLFAIMFAISILITLLSSIFKIAASTNTGMLLAGAPAWFYIYIVVFEPINEELFFRALLVPRVGIVVSALLFGAAHLGYNSTFQIDAIFALIFGLLGGYILKKTHSLYPLLAAHMLFDLMSIMLYKSA